MEEANGSGFCPIFLWGFIMSNAYDIYEDIKNALSDVSSMSMNDLDHYESLIGEQLDHFSLPEDLCSLYYDLINKIQNRQLELEGFSFEIDEILADIESNREILDNLYAEKDELITISAEFSTDEYDDEITSLTERIVFFESNIENLYQVIENIKAEIGE